MASFDEAMAELTAEMGKLGIEGYDSDLLSKIAKSQGPSIYLQDAKRVSCSDPEELARVKNNFLVRKLGMADDASLDTAIKAVCEQLGSSNRNKFRVIFYYLLTKNLGKESIFA